MSSEQQSPGPIQFPGGRVCPTSRLEGDRGRVGLFVLSLTRTLSCFRDSSVLTSSSLLCPETQDSVRDGRTSVDWGPVRKGVEGVDTLRRPDVYCIHPSPGDHG